MKEKKNEMMYLLLLMFSIFLIYCSFMTSFADVTISEIKKRTSVFFLSFDNFVYLTVGLFLLSFTIYLCMHLGGYMVGKLFALYLAFITASICLTAATNYHDPLGNGLIGIFAFFSNIFLFYSIGYITQLTHKKFFRYSAFFLCLSTVVSAVLYIVCMNSDQILLIILKDEIIPADYILTAAVTLFCMLMGYKGATVYSKSQIKFLSVGLLLGVLIFIGMRLMPMLAVMKVPENSVEMSVTYQAEITGGNQDIYPIMVFTGMAIAGIYILIKREYLTIDENRELRRYLLTVVYLITSNTYLLLLASFTLRDYIFFNAILCAPLVLYFHRGRKQEKNSYDNNLIEVLEEERERISVLLHDEVLQDLIAMSHSIKDEDVRERLSATIGEIRCISQDLYPTIVEDLGLEQALHIFINEISTDYNIDLKYQYNYPKGILPKSLSLVLYRTVKELVTNAIKHASCRSISVLISDAAGDIECIVSDDGCGFHMPESGALLKSPHMGLYTVKKQIASINGNMRIISDKSGSKFQVLIPLRS